MKNTKKLVLKILAGIVALLLISGIFFVTNAFVGNPISAAMANKAIERYVTQNYSNLDLQIEKSSYNFKDGSYAAMAKSKTSIDTKFAIYYQNGKVKRDNYDTYVLGMFNTLQRFSDEYSTIARSIIAKELGYENNTTMVMFDKGAYGSANGVLELDMKFDKSLPIDSEVTISLDLMDNSLEGIAKVLTDAHKAFVDNGCFFNKYSVYAENNGILVMVQEVTPDDIESDKFMSLLEYAKNHEGASGINVYIKEDYK